MDLRSERPISSASMAAFGSWSCRLHNVTMNPVSESSEGGRWPTVGLLALRQPERRYHFVLQDQQSALSAWVPTLAMTGYGRSQTTVLFVS